MSNARSRFDPASVTAELRSRWGWFVALGIVLLVLGFLAFGNLVIATVASVLYVGALMAVGAVAQIIHAFRVKRWGGFFFWLLSGLLYGAAGILAFLNPALADRGADPGSRRYADRLRHSAHLVKLPASA
jgi:uncharacterized membrane protein HdeD (DUF308 family)